MRCEQCRRNKFESLKPYGGMMLCDSCYDFHNPKLNTVYRLSPEHRKKIESTIIELESKIHKLKYELRTDDKIIKSGSNHLTFKSHRN